LFLDVSTTTISSSSSPSPDQLILSSTVPSSPLPNPNPPGSITTSSTASTSANGNFDDDFTGIAGGPCSRKGIINGITSAREYAFVDCSEVYLAGKRTSGIYEIW
jgi:hypothetical protein